MRVHFRVVSSRERREADLFFADLVGEPRRLLRTPLPARPEMGWPAAPSLSSPADVAEQPAPVAVAVPLPATIVTKWSGIDRSSMPRHVVAGSTVGDTAWMGTLPGHVRLRIGGSRLLLCHGSPRRINEFLWASTTPDPFIRRLLREHDADIIACTHTGLHWSRFVEPGRGVVNVGAIGRPANDGRTNVWFCMLEAAAGALAARFVPVAYDHEALAREMREESLPEEFIETIRTGWWTCCLEILPAKERGAGKL